MRGVALYLMMAVFIAIVGMTQSWNTALAILNMCLISAVIALGVNIQWGYAGLFNIGIMGFVALGGLGAVLVSMPPVTAAWTPSGGLRILAALALGVATIWAAIALRRRLPSGAPRVLGMLGVLILGFFAYRWLLDPAVAVVEANNPTREGYLGGLGLPILLGWPVGALLAAGAAWVVGKTALGLRSDYLAIATLGIAEIIIAVLKNEDWLTRGVKNVIGLPRPVPYEVNLQQTPWFQGFAQSWGFDLAAGAAIFVKLCYFGLFATVLVVLIVLVERALHSPWGRMMRAIRDNETAAEAMGKDVTRRHLQIFILGSAVCGLGGAMLTTLDSQLTPSSYIPLRHTFLIWVMVIVGGSGNNFGAILGGMLIWFFWVEAEPIGKWVMDVITMPMPDGWLKAHLLDSVQHMRLLAMGLILLLVLRFAPRGLIPEK